MQEWNVECAKCGSLHFKNERNAYVVTSDIDNPQGELIVMAECIECGHVQTVI